MVKLKSLVTQIGLIEKIDISLPIERNRLIPLLRQNIDKGGCSIFYNIFDLFSSSKNLYRGWVAIQGFKIRRKQKLFDNDPNWVVVKGTFSDDLTSTKIHLEISAFTGLARFLIFLLPFFYLLSTVFILSIPEIPNIVFLIIPFHALVIVFIPYWFMKRSVSKMKYNLERDIYYWVRNSLYQPK